MLRIVGFPAREKGKELGKSSCLWPGWACRFCLCVLSDDRVYCADVVRLFGLQGVCCPTPLVFMVCVRPTHISTLLSLYPLHCSPLPSTRLSQNLVQKPVFLPGSTMFNNMAFLSFPLMYVTPCAPSPRLRTVHSHHPGTGDAMAPIKFAHTTVRFSSHPFPLRRTCRWSQIANRTKKLEKAGTSLCCGGRRRRKRGRGWGGGGRDFSILLLLAWPKRVRSLAFALLLANHTQAQIWADARWQVWRRPQSCAPSSLSLLGS